MSSTITFRSLARVTTVHRTGRLTRRDVPDGAERRHRIEPRPERAGRRPRDVELHPDRLECSCWHGDPLAAAQPRPAGERRAKGREGDHDRTVFGQGAERLQVGRELGDRQPRHDAVDQAPLRADRALDHLERRGERMVFGLHLAFGGDPVAHVVGSNLEHPDFQRARRRNPEDAPERVLPGVADARGLLPVEGPQLLLRRRRAAAEPRAECACTQRAEEAAALRRNRCGRRIACRPRVANGELRCRRSGQPMR